MPRESISFIDFMVHVWDVFTKQKRFDIHAEGWIFMFVLKGELGILLVMLEASFPLLLLPSFLSLTHCFCFVFPAAANSEGERKEVPQAEQEEGERKEEPQAEQKAEEGEPQVEVGERKEVPQAEQKEEGERKEVPVTSQDDSKVEISGLEAKSEQEMDVPSSGGGGEEVDVFEGKQVDNESLELVDVDGLEEDGARLTDPPSRDTRDEL